MVRGDCMQRLMSVEDAAALTSQPPRRLRQWCATGQLVCERSGMAWEIEESQVDRIPGLAGQLGRLPDGRWAAALALPAWAAGPAIVRQVAQRLSLSQSDLALATVAIDGTERALLVWPVRSQASAAQALAGLADEVKGELLESSAMPSAPDRFRPGLRNTRRPASPVQAGQER